MKGAKPQGAALPGEALAQKLQGQGLRPKLIAKLQAGGLGAKTELETGLAIKGALERQRLQSPPGQLGRFGKPRHEQGPVEARKPPQNPTFPIALKQRISSQLIGQGAGRARRPTLLAEG